MGSNRLVQFVILIDHRTLTLEIGTSNIPSCVATMDSETLFYQSETEEATTHTEVHLPQAFVESQHNTTIQRSLTSITSAEISATPLMLVWESTDIIVTATPSKISNPRPPTATATTNAQQETRPSLSSGTVAAISASAALSVILLIAAYLFHRASKRRSSNNNPQPGVSAEKKPGEEVKAEMEDPLSAQTLFTQSGAYRGKPELGNEVNRPCLENLDNADTNFSPISNDQSAAGSSPDDRIISASVGAHPAELE